APASGCGGVELGLGQDAVDFDLDERLDVGVVALEPAGVDVKAQQVGPGAGEVVHVDGPILPVPSGGTAQEVEPGKGPPVNEPGALGQAESGPRLVPPGESFGAKLRAGRFPGKVKARPRQGRGPKSPVERSLGRVRGDEQQRAGIGRGAAGCRDDVSLWADPGQVGWDPGRRHQGIDFGLTCRPKDDAFASVPWVGKPRREAPWHACDGGESAGKVESGSLLEL